MKDLKIKVCGTRDKANIEALVQLPIDYMGFIFYPKSPRYIGNEIDKDILKLIPSHIQKTGVFVNAPIHEVLRVAQENQLQCVQLHGSEIPDYCEAIRDKGYKVIKAFKAEYETLTCETTAYQYVCDYYLFDTPTVLHGGSGQKFDWQILNKLHISLPFFLSGGISVDDVQDIKSLEIKGMHAVDINSKFELQPGIKDVELIKQFLSDLKK